MRLLSKFAATLFLASMLAVTCGFKGCSNEQKQAVEKASVASLCNRLSGKAGVPGDIGAAVCAFNTDKSESVFQQGVNAFNAALDRHNLSPTVREIVVTGEEIFKAFAPATFAEMDPNSPDGRAARKELEDKFKRLEKLVEQ
jgi:hypothetical protein